MGPLAGDAEAIHGRDPWAEGPGGSGRSVRLCRVTAPAVVLGSAQPSTHVDQDRAAAAGLEVVRRRSGGGAVLVSPGTSVWVEVAIPVADPLWEHDVGRAFWWLGQAWADALSSLGIGPAVVHGGPAVRTRWSELICFAGLGPGEVTVAGRKVVGLAQRRSRAGAVFHCAVPLAADAATLVSVLALSQDDRRRAAAAVEAGVAPLGPGLTIGDVETALVEHLPG